MPYVIERASGLLEEVRGAFQSGVGDDAVNHPAEWLGSATPAELAARGVHDVPAAEVPAGKVAIASRFEQRGSGVVQLLEVADVPVEVPASVTPRQLRLALLGAGRLAEVTGFVESRQAPEAAVISWEYATEFLRGDPMLGQFAAMLGMTDEDVDGLFIAAAQIP